MNRLTRFSKVGVMLGLLCGTLAGGIPQTMASKKIWQQPANQANFVGIEKYKSPQGAPFKHPHTFTADQLASMFLSLRFNKAVMFKDKLTDQKVFFDEELLDSKFIPRIVEAFQKVGPDEAVIVSVVQKDPYFIIRNDRLNLMRVYVTDEGLVISFIKLHAKLTGDYQARTTGNRLIEESKGLEVSLEPQKGQKLGLENTRTIVLDMNYDFGALVDQKNAEDEVKENEKKNKKRSGKKEEKKDSKMPESPDSVPPAKPSKKDVSPTPSQPAKKSTAERLEELKTLKEKGVITPSEYDSKRREILKDL